MNRRAWITAAAVGLITGLFYYFPATLAARLQTWVAPELQLYGASGTLLHGHAVAAQVRGLIFEKAEWEWQPLALLLGRFSAEVRAETQRQPVAGRVSLGPGSRLRLYDFTALLETAQLGPLLGMRWLPVDGQLDVVLDELRIKGRQPRHAEGQLKLRGAQWRLLQPPAALGDLRAELRTEDDRIIADLSSDPGPLKLGGQVELDEEGGYKVDLRLQPGSEADSSLMNMLRGLGQPDADGAYRLQLQGKLPGLSG